MTNDRRRRGFTLLEVLVAFVVLALSLSALLPALTTLGHRGRLAEDRWLAGELALSRLEAAGVTTPLARGDDSGAWQDWRWTVEVRPLRSAPPESERFATFYEVTVEVTDGDGLVLARLATVKRAPESDR